MDFGPFPPLSKLLVVETHQEQTHVWCEVRMPQESRDPAALRVAVHIAWHRCGGAPQYFDAWFERLKGAPPHDPDLLGSLEAFVASESIGTPADPASDEHLEGFVAEHIWHLLTAENAIGWGKPVRIDGPDWSATDAGGDGLAVYRFDHKLAFRLWESKGHKGHGLVRDVVNAACLQVSRKALRYLARFSKIGQTLPDQDLKRFYGQLPELWRRRARAAGGGVSVSTGEVDIDRSFENLHAYWEMTHQDQRQGLVVVIEEFPAFAKRVREILWTGL